MSDLTIEHTAGDGTLLRGSARGDGVAALLKPLGWRWGRTLSAWYLPRSRDTAPRAAVIEDTTTTLRAAGHAVTITLDHEPRTPAEVAQDRQRRSRARADRLEHLRGSALGFRNLANYIARSLLEAGGFRPRLHPGL